MARRTYTTESVRETRALAERFFRTLQPHKTKATVVGLIGELGAGKTAFTKGAAAGLGLARKMPSPTFVIMRKYALPKKSSFKTLYHCDAYRITKKRELDVIHFFRILKDPTAVCIIEWANNIRAHLPKETHIIYFTHGKHKEVRTIQLPYEINTQKN